MQPLVLIHNIVFTRTDLRHRDIISINLDTSYCFLTMKQHRANIILYKGNISITKENAVIAGNTYFYTYTYLPFFFASPFKEWKVFAPPPPSIRLELQAPSVHRTTASTFKQCFGPGLHKRFLTNEKKVLSSPGLAPINKCITYSS